MNNKGLDNLKPDALNRLRDELFAHQVRHQLYAFSPYYKKLIDKAGFGRDDFEAVSDLQKLPTTPRSRLARDPVEFYLRPTRKLIQKYGAFRQVASVAAEIVIGGSDRSEKAVRSEYENVHELHTAGTQGRRIPIRISKRDLTKVAAAGRRMLEITAVKPADVVLNLLETDPGGRFLCPWLGGIELEINHEAPGRLGAQAAMDYLKRLRPGVLIAHGPDVQAMLDQVGLPPATLKTVILAPDPGVEQAAQAIRQRLMGDVRVVSTYWFAEARVWWADCSSGPQSYGYHTNPELEVVEAVASVDEASSPGDMEIAYTGLDHRGTALARYLPGDVIGGIESGVCPGCGRYQDRIMGPIFRLGRFVTINVRGRLVSLEPGKLEAAIGPLRLSRWQIEVGRPAQSNGVDEVLLLFQPAAGTDPAKLAVELDRVFRSTFGFRPAQIIMSDRAEDKVVDLRPGA